MMRDFHLILFVLALVLIDVVFITVWIFYDPLKPEDIVFDDLVKLLSLYSMFNIKCRNTIYFSMRKTSLSQAVFVVKVAGTNVVK